MPHPTHLISPYQPRLGSLAATAVPIPALLEGVSQKGPDIHPYALQTDTQSIMGYKIEGCTIDDAAGLGRNNASAYWEQPYWRMLWPQDMDREFIIEQVQKRIGPAVLLRDRDHLRQEKAVDEETGDIIGYARWNFSEALVKSHEGEVLWADRQVPNVDDEMRKELEEEMDASWWEPRSDMGELDVKIDDARKRLHAQEKHIGESLSNDEDACC